MTPFLVLSSRGAFIFIPNIIRRPLESSDEALGYGQHFLYDKKRGKEALENKPP